MKKITKEFVMEPVRWVAMWVATFYGITFTTAIGIQILMDELWVSERLEGIIMMTCVPAMIWGLRKLRGYWIEQALSKRAKETTELTVATAA